MNQGGRPEATREPIIDPAEVPTITSAVAGSQPVSRARASSPPVSQAPPWMPPAPRTKPTLITSLPGETSPYESYGLHGGKAGRRTRLGTYDFANKSEDIARLFTWACELVGIRGYRLNGSRRGLWDVRINRRGSVAQMRQHVGLKA